MKPPHSPELAAALAACRAICFATRQAGRWGGTYSATDLFTAHNLALVALKMAEPLPADKRAKPANPKKPVKKKRRPLRIS